MEEEQKKPVDEKATEESNEGLEHVPEDSNLSVIEQARAERKLVDAQLERREKLIEREERIRAEEILAPTGGKGVEPKKEFSEEEQASRARIKSVADASGSDWGKNYG